jgi:ribonuclease D
MNIQRDISDADLNRLLESERVAVDCEMGGLNPLRDNLYLVQLCDPNKTINIIKTDDWQSAVNLRELFVSAGLVKVFHFAIMDCAFILSHCKVTVQSPYCTKIASKLARTYSGAHSLSSLLEDLLGIKKDKSVQTSFWGREEISKEQVEYAANDVRYLLEVQRSLEEILAAKGKLPSNISYLELNEQCQKFIPTLVHLWINGWDFGKEDINSIFGK